MERRSEENQIPLQPYNEHGDDPQRGMLMQINQHSLI